MSKKAKVTKRKVAKKVVKTEVVKAENETEDSSENPSEQSGASPAEERSSTSETGNAIKSFFNDVLGFFRTIVRVIKTLWWVLGGLATFLVFFTCWAFCDDYDLVKTICATYDEFLVWVREVAFKCLSEPCTLSEEAKPVTPVTFVVE